MYVPNLNELRSLEQFAGAETVLSTDNCASDAKQQVSNLFQDARVRALTWPRDGAHISHEVGLILVGVAKR
jgi:hypothetical protein